MDDIPQGGASQAAGKTITAADASDGFYEPTANQRTHHLRQVVNRNVVTFGNFGSRELFTGLAGEMQHCVKCIAACFLQLHLIKLPFKFDVRSGSQSFTTKK